MANKITAKNLVDLLAARHSRDVFIPECKTGPTQGVTDMQRIDAWAMKRSWAHPLSIAYEIKVSRSDFLADNKWRGYLPYCNQFAFVAPANVVTKDEVPPEAGLVVCSQNGTRLYTKKKAPYRDLVIPNSLLLYVLFSRVKVQREQIEDSDAAPASFWRRWLEGKQDLKELGYRVSRTMRKRLDEEIKVRDRKQKSLDRDLGNLSIARDTLIQLGFPPGHIPAEWSLKNKLEQLKHAVPPDVLEAIQKASRVLQRCEKVLLSIEDTQPQNSKGRTR